MTEDNPQQTAIQVDESFVRQAMQAELEELRHSKTMLTALVNQQQQQIIIQGRLIQELQEKAALPANKGNGRARPAKKKENPSAQASD
jgi:hypothetical protein